MERNRLLARFENVPQIIDTHCCNGEWEIVLQVWEGWFQSIKSQTLDPKIHPNVQCFFFFSFPSIILFPVSIENKEKEVDNCNSFSEVFVGDSPCYFSFWTHTQLTLLFYSSREINEFKWYHESLPSVKCSWFWGEKLRIC